MNNKTGSTVAKNLVTNCISAKSQIKLKDEQSIRLNLETIAAITELPEEYSDKIEETEWDSWA